jgi:hypothetical protein
MQETVNEKFHSFYSSRKCVELDINCARLFVRGKLVHLFTVLVSSIEAQPLFSRDHVNTARAAAAFMFMFNIIEDKQKPKRKVLCRMKEL